MSFRKLNSSKFCFEFQDPIPWTNRGWVCWEANLPDLTSNLHQPCWQASPSLPTSTRVGLWRRSPRHFVNQKLSWQVNLGWLMAMSTPLGFIVSQHEKNPAFWFDTSFQRWCGESPTHFQRLSWASSVSVKVAWNRVEEDRGPNVALLQPVENSLENSVFPFPNHFWWICSQCHDFENTQKVPKLTPQQNKTLEFGEDKNRYKNIQKQCNTLKWVKFRWTRGLP